MQVSIPLQPLNAQGLPAAPGLETRFSLQGAHGSWENATCLLPGSSSGSLSGTRQSWSGHLLRRLIEHLLEA